MERNLFLSVLVATLLLIALAMFIPGQRESDSIETLPWHITIDGAGRSTIFGITLEQTTLAEVEQLFGSEAEISLFSSAEGGYTVEAFFNRVTLNGIKAKFVFVVGLSAQALQQSYERGVRIATMGSGTRKVTLADSDLTRVMATAVTSLTYLPRLDLDTALLEQRFGTPAEQIATKEGIIHWLYPQQGLDIALYTEGKEVFNYVIPARFEQLRGPLLAVNP